MTGDVAGDVDGVCRRLEFDQFSGLDESLRLVTGDTTGVSGEVWALDGAVAGETCGVGTDSGLVVSCKDIFEKTFISWQSSVI